MTDLQNPRAREETGECDDFTGDATLRALSLLVTLKHFLWHSHTPGPLPNNTVASAETGPGRCSPWSPPR